MIDKGWTVSKWQNNIDLKKGIMHAAKRNMFNSLGTGFPDFVAFRNEVHHNIWTYKVMLVECKLNGKLTKMEKEKLKFLQDEGIPCFVAYKDESQEKNLRLREYINTEKRESIPRGI